MSLEDQYNKLYSESEKVFCGGEPESIVEDILNYRHEGSVLELGAGQGRNALFLASRGFEVTAQDLSTIGTDSIAKQAAKHNLGVKIERGDVRMFNPQKNFDIVVSTYLLHHLSSEEASELIRRMQAHTNPGGLNAISVFTRNGDFYTPGTDRFYPDTNEMKRIYADWDILEYEEKEGDTAEKKPDGTQMKVVTARLLARKREV